MLVEQVVELVAEGYSEGKQIRLGTSLSRAVSRGRTGKLSPQTSAQAFKLPPQMLHVVVIKKEVNVRTS